MENVNESLIFYINELKNINPLGFPKSINISFLSNFTIKGLPEVISYHCKNLNTYAKIYEAPYDNFIQEILNESSNFYMSEPEITFLILDTENFLGDLYNTPYLNSPEEIKKAFSEKQNLIEHLLLKLKENSKTKIVFSSFVLPIHTSRGIIENKQENSLSNMIRGLNLFLENLSKQDNNLFIFDINHFYSKYGRKNILDNKLKYLADMKISPKGIAYLGYELNAFLYPFLAKTRKCIVLDLDNTLWGGVIGEDGIDKIKLGPDKEGKPFLDFQKKLLELNKRGILLAINSKNNLEDVMNVLKSHKYMILKENNFSSLKINWKDKASNLREISKELNIGLDSLVFFDDDPLNISLVKSILPEVESIVMPNDYSDYPDLLDKLFFFETTNITQEDFKRGQLYIEQRQRDESSKNFSDLDDFLKSLNLKILISKNSEKDIPRIAQLINKTNQFNMTTLRMSEEEVRSYISSNSKIIYSIEINDKFGDYGLSGVLLVSLSGDLAMIDNFLLSCRVLGRKVENTILNYLFEQLKKKGIKRVDAKFIKSKKNKPAESLYSESGFNIKSKNEESTEYSIILGNESLLKSFAKVV